MNKTFIYRFITVVTTLLTITVNVLANALPINGQGPGEISDRFAIYFVPEGYVFSIWGIIYLGLIAFVLYQLLPGQKESDLIEKVSPAFWAANLANTAWIFLWHYEFFPLTVVLMLTLLASLLYLYLQVARHGELTSGQKWLVKLPFSIYLGWISVATVANVSQVLFYADWRGWGVAPEGWTVIMLVIAGGLGLAMRWRENDWAYGLVLIWALVGIALKQSESALVSNTAWVIAGVLALALVSVPFIKRAPRKG